jgi:hypothetical protein
MKRMTGVTMAAAAASLFAISAAPIAQAAEAPMVKCMGINSCKGQTKCATAEGACAGQNSCKGHGWLPTTSAKACTDKGGKVL